MGKKEEKRKGANEKQRHWWNKKGTVILPALDHHGECFPGPGNKESDALRALQELGQLLV